MPLLFAIALEPLAEAITVSTSIQDLVISTTQHKISLYADDVLLFITSPETSMPPLVNVIRLFSSFSGYKINFNKSEAMPLGSLTDMPNTIPFFFLSNGPQMALDTWGFL